MTPGKLRILVINLFIIYSGVRIIINL